MNDETNGDGEAEVGRSFRRGDAAAAAEVRARVQRIVGFRGYRVPAEERRDLVQEVMTQLWQAVNRPGFDAEGGFWGFVEVLAARRCIDWLRARKPETALIADVEEPARGPMGAALERERVALARAALERLGEPCRQLIRLRIAQDRPYREIAGILGRSEGALRIQMHRCIEEARRLVSAATAGSGGDAAGRSG